MRVEFEVNDEFWDAIDSLTVHKEKKEKKEIVHCRDCKHYIPNIPKLTHIGYALCNHEYQDGLEEGTGYEWKPDDFCSRGERINGTRKTD